MVTNGTTIVRLTPFGKEVSRILETEEIRGGYPTTRKILLLILMGRLEQKGSEINEESLLEFLTSGEKTSTKHEAIGCIIKKDFVSSQLVEIFRNFT